MLYFGDEHTPSRELGIEIDKSTLNVLRFMQRNVNADKLVPVAELVNKMAPILWGHYDRKEIYPTRIYTPPITADEDDSTINKE